MSVRVGEWDLVSTKEPYPHEDYEVDSIKLHPQYVDQRYEVENNVGLIFTKETIKFFPHVQPICLPWDTFFINGDKCVVAGWGKKNMDDKTNVNIMKRIELPFIYKNNECEDQLKKNTGLGKVEGGNWKLHESSMCAGGQEGIGKSI